jgi:hypothetical protein
MKKNLQKCRRGGMKMEEDKEKKNKKSSCWLEASVLDVKSHFK